MATYYFEPDIADLGSAPSNAVFSEPWSNAYIDLTVTTGNYTGVELDVAAVTTTNALAAFDSIESVSVDPVTVTEAYALVWPRGSGNSLFLAVACNGTLFSTADGYMAGINRDSGNFELRKVFGGSRSILDSASGAANEDFHILFKITDNGSTVTLQAKIWLDGNSEPGTWTLEHTDSSPLSLSGKVGLAQVDRTTSYNPQFYKVGIGTGGDSAPRSSSTPVSFSGTVPQQDLTENEAMSTLDLSTYFSGTETPFSYAVQSGSLPTGLSLNSSTGEITGTPTEDGTFSIVVRATDDGSDTADTNEFDIVVTAVRVGFTLPDSGVIYDGNADTQVADDTDVTILMWQSATLPSTAVAPDYVVTGADLSSGTIEVDLSGEDTPPSVDDVYSGFAYWTRADSSVPAFRFINVTVVDLDA
jgi:hypothetical protein